MNTGGTYYRCMAVQRYGLCHALNFITVLIVFQGRKPLHDWASLVCAQDLVKLYAQDKFPPSRTDHQID